MKAVFLGGAAVTITITVHHRRLCRWLVVAIALLTVVSLLGLVSKYFLGHDVVFGLVPLFDLDGEGNVPTWFNSTLLLVCAIHLALISVAVRQHNFDYLRHWRVLALIFLYLAIDEASEIHELTARPIRTLLGVGGFLHYAWVIPAGVLLLAFGLAYLRFMRALPAQFRRLTILAGCIYLAGAVGLEILGAGLFRSGDRPRTFGYGLITHLEECLEMVGIVVFIYALGRYLESCSPDVHLRFESEKPAANPAE